MSPRVHEVLIQVTEVNRTLINTDECICKMSCRGRPKRLIARRQVYFKVTIYGLA